MATRDKGFLQGGHKRAMVLYLNLSLEIFCLEMILFLILRPLVHSEAINQPHSFALSIIAIVFY